MVVSNPDKWEVVGNKTSKAKPKPNDKKTGKGGSAEKDKKTPIVKLDELVPLDTRFGILDPELKEQAKQQQQKQKEKEKEKAKELEKKKTDKPAVKPKETKAQTLDEAIKDLRIEQLRSVLDNVTSKFQDTPSVWLKDLVGFLNLKLAVDADPVYGNKPRDYPSSLLPAEVRKAILSTLSACPEPALQAFYQQFFPSISSDMNKGLHVEGTKIVLQLLSSQKPDIVLPCVSRYGEHLRSIQSRVPACLASLWVLSQAAVKNPRVGVQVFTEAMLPLLGLKNFAPYISSTALAILPKITSSGVGKESISLASYLKFFDLYHGIGGNSLSGHVRKEIQPFFEALSKVALQNLGSQLFVPLFNRLKTEVGHEKVVCELLADLFEAAPESAKLWVGQYKSNLQTSGVLLKFIAENRPALARDFSQVREALQELKELNEEIPPGSKNAAALNDCILHVEVLLQHKQKQKSSGCSLKFYNYVLFFALASLVYYDVTHNGKGRFADSRLGVAAEKFGIAEQYNRVYAKAEPYVDEALVKLGPYVESAKIYAGEAYTYVYNKGEELRPGVWKELGDKYEVYAGVVREKYGVVAEIAKEKYDVYSEVAKEKLGVAFEATRKHVTEFAKTTWEKAAPYAEQGVNFTKKYINEENVNFVWKSVNEAYHRALHKLGLCSH